MKVFDDHNLFIEAIGSMNSTVQPTVQGYQGKRRTYHYLCIGVKGRVNNLGEKTMENNLYPTVQELYCYPEERITFNFNSIRSDFDWHDHVLEKQLKMPVENFHYLENNLHDDDVLQNNSVNFIFAVHASSCITVVTIATWETISENCKLIKKMMIGPIYYIAATHHVTISISHVEELQSLHSYKSQRVLDEDVIICKNQSQRSPGNDGKVAYAPFRSQLLKRTLRRARFDQAVPCERRLVRPTLTLTGFSESSPLGTDAKHLKLNMTSTVNKPNHKDGNQNTVYNHQDAKDNKQPNPDLNREKRSDQKVKGVNIKTRKQPGEDAKWLNNMKGKLILKPYVRNLKQNMTSTVNKPNHQDGNQNTVYNHQDNKQTNPDVNCEKRSDQKAKGVNIKTGKQPGEDAKWLMPKLMFLLKPLFLLLLMSLPATSATPHDFKWLPTNKTVKGLYETNITLVWKYESSSVVDKIDISRSKNEYEKEKVAIWTPEKGSVENRLITTAVTLEHRKEGDVGTINLTFVMAYPLDFDKMYSCIISSEHELYSMDKELEAYKLEYMPVDDVVEGRPGQDVKLDWIYKYPLPIKYVNFDLDNDIQGDVLKWSSFAGIYYIEDRYKNRVKLNMTSNNDQVNITLTLLNTTRDDYNHTYHSQAIVPKGYWTIKDIYLRPSPVEEEEKPDVKTVSSRQQPSSTSGLFKVSIFLVCFVCLLALQL